MSTTGIFYEKQIKSIVHTRYRKNDFLRSQPKRWTRTIASLDALVTQVQLQILRDQMTKFVWALQEIRPTWEQPLHDKGPEMIPGGRQDQSYAFRCSQHKQKYGDFDGEVSSYLRKTKLSYDDKLFGYCESLCNLILQKEFKFNLSNLDRKSDDSNDLFDYITNYQTSSTYKEQQMQSCVVPSPRSTRKGHVFGIIAFPRLNWRIWLTMTCIHLVVLDDWEYMKNHSISPQYWGEIWRVPPRLLETVQWG